MKKPCAKVCLTLVLASGLVSAGLAASPPTAASGPGLDSITGAGNSFTPSFSGDGRFVVFVSHANNFVTNDNNARWLDVFVRDLAASNTVLVSVNRTGVGGGDGNSNFPTLSSNGQFVAFESAAGNLAGHDTNGVSDSFVRDMAAGTTALVSVNSDGTASANKASTAPLISDDGRWVIFESTATNLVAVPTGGTNNLFARDLQSGMTMLVSVNTNGTASGNGASDSASLSADGRFVAFVSTADNLVPGGTNRLGEIYVRDLQSGTTVRASTGATGTLGIFGPLRCFDPVLSADGRFVVFKAAKDVSTNLLRRDLPSNTLAVVRANSVGPSSPEISADGRFIAYEGLNQVIMDVYRWDAQSGTNELVALHRNVITSTTSPSHSPVISADGQVIAFLSAATDLASNAIGGLLLRNMTETNIALVSASRFGTNSSSSGAELFLILPALSCDGRLVAYESTASDIVVNDFNRASDVFLRDVVANATSLVSQRHPTRPALSAFAHSTLGPRGVGGNGRYIAFTSGDGNLSESDTNNLLNVFVRDVVTGTNYFIGGHTNLSLSPLMSAQGRVLVYADGLAGSFSPRIFWRDVTAAGNARFVNLNTSQAVSYGTATATAISGDGRWVVYQSTASDLVSGIPDANSANDIYLRDMAVTTNFPGGPPIYGSNYLISVNRFGGTAGNAASINAVLSADAQWIVFQSRAQDLTTNSVAGTFYQLFARNPFTRQTRLASSLGANGAGLAEEATGAVVSANSRYVAFHTATSGTIYRHDLLNSGSNDLVCTGCRNASISFDGRLVAYESRASGTNFSDIFVRDLVTGSNELLSVNRAGSGGGNGHSTTPLISYSGRFVVFTSKAGDLADNDTNGVSDVFVRDRLAGTTFLISANAQGTGSGNLVSSKPVLAPDGRTVVFQSFASDLMPGDFNDRRDIFVLSLAAPDGDGDGLDDDWELAYFNTLARDGTGDFDGDGSTDAQEFLAGTDPTNSGSILRALTVTFGYEAGGAGYVARVYWSSAVGKTYRVQYKNQVNDPGWTNLPGLITASGPTATAVDTMSFSPAVRRFYRVVLTP